MVNISFETVKLRIGTRAASKGFKRVCFRGKKLGIGKVKASSSSNMPEDSQTLALEGSVTALKAEFIRLG